MQQVCDLTLFPSFRSALLRDWLPFLNMSRCHNMAVGGPALHLYSRQEEGRGNR